MANTDNELAERFTEVDLKGVRDAGLNTTADLDYCEEAVTSDSEEYLSDTSRFENFITSTSSEMSTVTLTSQLAADGENNYNLCNGSFNLSNIEIPIVGYEVMEKRGRFTVYKLRIENKASGDCWYVFRRYTDFVRLCNRFKDYPNIVQHLPRKRLIGNNFEPAFLEERVSSLQTLVNALITEPELASSQQIQDFFCLNEPPIYSETNEESRAIFEALEDTIYQLKQQLMEKDGVIDSLHDKLHQQANENENLRKLLKDSKMNSQKDNEDISKMLK
ncbi:PREDICTED: sorting nexin-16 isoform X1 [Nicrophorus vespilloides]|uniref:Sorting nexin-16 isoform X1 n=1 Tax=Nicrophorus vespilloides TaxID=110193 RepID=A0ABM1NJ21_NICVS|nr:PREDICTED: sorting nexin-16 isoform X1 [Nicrophorus vespilloides]XP_017786821.1 PREDICTED: sorting nexin-16 isoform X1 [Nicrophorus vespilloides]